jgi:hypothetical protein
MAVLSAKQRQNLPKSSFALPGKGKGPKGAGAGAYPVPDRAHAKAALSRVSQFGSPAEKATVRAKVRAKFPGMGAKARGGAVQLLAEGGPAKDRADRPKRRGGMCG